MTKISIGIDFGTANSYFVRADAEGGDTESFAWGANDGDPANKVLETAVLYRNGKPIEIGETAYEEWESTKDDRLEYWFKPEVGESPKADEAARDFFRVAGERQARYHRDLLPRGSTVVVGVPVDATANFKRALRTALEERHSDSGIAIELVKEPYGALVNLLQQERWLDLDQVRSNILVVDFGAGTLDFTWVSEGRVHKTWGEYTLGGRLFDDLFYQIMLERHPNAEYLKAVPPEEQRMLQSLYCRREKEAFSEKQRQRLQAGGRAPDGVVIGKALREMDKKNLTGTFELTYDGFREAARNYRPSDILLQDYPGDTKFGKRIRTIPGGGKDLLEWFREVLLQKGSLKDVQRIYLAGGSSRWPWVEEITKEACAPDVKVLPLPGEPYMVVANGLAILPRQREIFEALADEMEKGKGEFIEKLPGKVLAALEPEIDRISGELAKVCLEEAVDPVLRVAHQEKLSEDQVKKKIEAQFRQACEGEHRRGRVLLMDWARHFNKSLADEFQEWVNDKAKDTYRHRFSQLRSPGIPLSTVRGYLGVGVFGTWTLALTGMAALETGLLGSGLLGSSQLAVIAALDPTFMAWVIFGVVTAAIAVISRNPRVRSWHFNGQMEKMADTARRSKALEQMRPKLVKQLKKELRKLVNAELKPEGMVGKYIDEAIQNVRYLSNIETS